MRRMASVAFCIMLPIVLLAACTSPTPSGVPVEQYDKLSADLAAAQARISQLQSETSSLKEKVTDLETSNSDLQAENARLKRQLQTPVPTTTATPPPSTTAATPTNPPSQQAVFAGQATWTLTSAQDKGSVLPKSESRYPSIAKDMVTTGKFIKVAFTVENIASAPATWPNEPTLVDSRGREFKEAEGSYEYVPDGMEWSLPTLQPGVPKSFVIMFEVARDAVGLSLKVNDLTSDFMSPPRTALIGLGF